MDGGRRGLHEMYWRLYRLIFFLSFVYNEELVHKIKPLRQHEHHVIQVSPL